MSKVEKRIKKLPKPLRSWLFSLPQADQEREVEIAERNLAKITAHKG